MVQNLGIPSIPSTPTRTVPSRFGFPSTTPSRPGTSQRPVSCHGSISATSWKTSNVRHIAQQVVQPLIKQASSLIHAYMVCGLNRDPTEWLVAPKASNGRPQRTNGAVGSFLSPQILGSIPPYEKDEEAVQTFAAALKAVFPNDCEICIGSKPPGTTCHSFVLQMNPTRSLYGVALRLWVRSDKHRLSKMASILETSELDNLPTSSSVWIPYCISYLSHYPLFDLMSDYIRCSWTLWSKDPDKFNNEGVLRLMKMPPPKPDQFLRIGLDEYTLCYQIPSLSSDFQNFPLWPIFMCLSAKNIVGVLEAALSPKGRIIFISHHAAILTVVAETIRYYLRSWTGLYVPVVYGRHAQGLVDEPAPYILGITKQSRPLYNAPKDSLVVDIDFDRIFTSRPPGSLSQRQRMKYASQLEQAIQGVSIEGVPNHLRSAYEQSVRFSAFGGIMAEDTTQWVKEPGWWDHSRVLAAMNHVCDRVRRNFKLLAVWKNMTQSTKVREQDLAEIIHDRNNIARSLDEAWREYINFKQRADIRAVAHRKGEAKLNADLDKQKKDFEELSECTEALIEETRQLQSVISQKTRDLARVERQLLDKTTHARQMSSHASELQNDLDTASKQLKAQQDLLKEMEKSRSRDTLSQERDDAQRAVIHLTSLISGQVAYIERVMASLISPSRPSSQQDLRKDVTKRQSMRSSSPQMSPVPRRMGSRRNTDGQDRRLSQAIVPETDSFDDKVKIITETVRKINNQCFAAIEDLASKREGRSPGGYEGKSPGGYDSNESDAALSPMPDLDSRADTRQSGSIADPGDSTDVGGAVRIHGVIAEEMESETEGEYFVDAVPVVDKKSGGMENFERGIGISMPVSV